uniref:Uncharacterized protein n=1 Tax=Timema monikensis TaxID=170555 RepID=A0A7R9EJU5_9NEOP|nr:unnamed protein product [Timema monikensis]
MAAKATLITLNNGKKIPVLGFGTWQVKEEFGNQINLCRDRGLNLGPPAQKSHTLPLDCQKVTEISFTLHCRLDSDTADILHAMDYFTSAIKEWACMILRIYYVPNVVHLDFLLSLDTSERNYCDLYPPPELIEQRETKYNSKKMPCYQ